MFHHTALQSMLNIPPISMRVNLLNYMIQSFHATTQKFVLPEISHELAPDAEDVTSILGLNDTGTDVADFINKYGKEAQTRIPPHFLNKNSGEIEIDDLIRDIVKNQPNDDDFIRKTVLILLGTVLAPYSLKYVPKSYYCLVENVLRIHSFNWNAFTLRVLLHSITKFKRENTITRWPKGNLAFVQVRHNYCSLNLSLLLILKHFCFYYLHSTFTGKRDFHWMVRHIR